jgi:hypothetical protein
VKEGSEGRKEVKGVKDGSEGRKEGTDERTNERTNEGIKRSKVERWIGRKRRKKGRKGEK